MSLNKNIPKRYSNYIKEIAGTSEALLGKNSIKAVILFGSLSHGKMSKISDIDLLIITKNSIERKLIDKIRPILFAIEIKYGLAKFPNNWMERIISVVNRSTGMYCSHFICKYEDWIDNDFNKIFSTSLLLTKFLAPSRIVLDSMKKGASVLYKTGKFSINIQIRQYSKIQLVKSLIMNLFIWLGGMVILPFNNDNIIYIIESFKWSLRSCSFSIQNKIHPLAKIILNYSKISNVYNRISINFLAMGRSKNFLQYFCQLRNNSVLNLVFCLQAPFQIFKLHFLTIRFLNFQNKPK